MADADSAAIDDDEDDDEDDLDILNSYADVLDDDWENDEDVDVDGRADGLEDEERGQTSLLDAEGEKGGPRFPADGHSSISGSSVNPSSLLSATLLLLQNLSTEELRQVERATISLRMKQRDSTVELTPDS